MVWFKFRIFLHQKQQVLSAEAPIWLPQAAKQRETRGLQGPALCSKVGAQCSGISSETIMVFLRQNYQLFYVCASLAVLLLLFFHPITPVCATLSLFNLTAPHQGPCKEKHGKGDCKFSFISLPA